MSFIQQTSPHAQSAVSTQRVMRTVILATLPGLAAMVFFFGLGPLFNVLLCCLLCLAVEAAVLAIRNRPVGFYLND